MLKSFLRSVRSSLDEQAGDRFSRLSPSRTTSGGRWPAGRRHTSSARLTCTRMPWYTHSQKSSRAHRNADWKRSSSMPGNQLLTRKVQAEASSPCGCTGRRAAPGGAGWPGARGDGWGRFACVFVCVSAWGSGRDMCVWAVHCGELGLRLYVCSLKWVERWPVPGMFHDVVQPQEGG